ETEMNITMQEETKMNTTTEKPKVKPADSLELNYTFKCVGEPDDEWDHEAGDGLIGTEIRLSHKLLDAAFAHVLVNDGERLRLADHMSIADCEEYGQIIRQMNIALLKLLPLTTQLVATIKETLDEIRAAQMRFSSPELLFDAE